MKKKLDFDEKRRRQSWRNDQYDARWSNREKESAPVKIEEPKKRKVRKHQMMMPASLAVAIIGGMPIKGPRV